MTLRFSGNIGAHLHMSWLDPQKVRRLVLVGSRKMADYDDTRADGKLLIHDKGVELPSVRASLDGYAMPEIRSGLVDAPVLDAAEPLRVECAHFIECIQTGQPPLTDGDHALTVIHVLETAQRSIAMQGAPERLDGSDLRARTDLAPSTEEVPLRR